LRGNVCLHFARAPWIYIGQAIGDDPETPFLNIGHSRVMAAADTASHRQSSAIAPPARNQALALRQSSLDDATMGAASPKEVPAIAPE